MSLFTFNINQNFDPSFLKKMMKLLLENNLNIKKIMATIQDLTAQVDDLQAALDNEQAQIAVAIEGLNQSIADLTALVAEGGTAVERQALADKLSAIKADLEGTIPNTTGETTTEAPVL